MFPKGFIAPLILGAATTWLQIHQRDAVGTLGYQRWRVGLEKGYYDLVVGIVVTGIGNWPTSGYQSIPCLQFGDAPFVFLFNTFAKVISRP